MDARKLGWLCLILLSHPFLQLLLLPLLFTCTYDTHLHFQIVVAILHSFKFGMHERH